MAGKKIQDEEIGWEHRMQRDKIAMIKALVDELKKQTELLEEIRDAVKKK
jgi:hypothetical protein